MMRMRRSLGAVRGGRLGGDRCSECYDDRDGKGAHHAASPSSIGRTFTTFIMPACMW